MNAVREMMYKRTMNKILLYRSDYTGTFCTEDTIEEKIVRGNAVVEEHVGEGNVYTKNAGNIIQTTVVREMMCRQIMT